MEKSPNKIKAEETQKVSKQNQKQKKIGLSKLIHTQVEYPKKERKKKRVKSTEKSQVNKLKFSKNNL